MIRCTSNSALIDITPCSNLKSPADLHVHPVFQLKPAICGTDGGIANLHEDLLPVDPSLVSVKVLALRVIDKSDRQVDEVFRQ